jgi:iron(III) transport system ATP-binding protein
MTLELREVSLTRCERVLLDRVSFSLAAGRTAMITGVTGAGKTSLLRCIAGLSRPTSGNITFDEQPWHAPGIELPTEARDLGMVFQDLVLWPHLRVREQLEITLQDLGRVERRARTKEVLEVLGIGDIAGRYPGELSGGQQQRLAIGRALARRPRLALLDEPTNQLDRSMAEQVSQWLRTEQIDSGRALVLVTHDKEVGQLLGVAEGDAWELAGGSLRPSGDSG